VENKEEKAARDAPAGDRDGRGPQASAVAKAFGDKSAVAKALAGQVGATSWRRWFQSRQQSRDGSATFSEALRFARLCSKGTI
jgi:hypothetical protein